MISIMGLKKKKNVIIITVCVIVSFILYQLYFFLTITSETGSSNKIIQFIDHKNIENLVHIRTENDKFINENGVIRGVFFSNIKDYRPDSKKEFKCLSLEQRIPFEQVNDDYCDCEDGTDEPSTSACPSGVFYCDTQNQRKHLLNKVPSSKVNDGICDCCDGSDEWDIHSRLLSQNSKLNYRYIVNKCSNLCT